VKDGAEAVATETSVGVLGVDRVEGATAVQCLGGQHLVLFVLHVPCHSRITTFTMHSMLFSVLAFAALLLPTQALYFYIDGPSQKCFFEELPKDTLVVGE
jgi:hypothetical protein